MKKILLALLLLCATVSANDLTVDYADLIGADTNGTRTDTAYTPSMFVGGYDRLWFTVSIKGLAYDTGFANDSYFVFIQHSPNKIDWSTTGNDTLQKILKGDNDTTLNIATSINRDSVVVGNYVRVKFLHRNALANKQALTANTYSKRLRAWVSYVD